MCVLIEALCLVIPNHVLNVSYPGGAAAFVDEVSARTDVRYAVTDGRLTAASMFDPSVGAALADHLMTFGMVGSQDREAVEFVFADMEVGPTIPCKWLESVRHPHGFMIGWHADGEQGMMAAPGDWDPSRSWSLERTDIRDEPDRAIELATEDGYVTLLDLATGRIDEAPEVRSPVVPVGQATPESPERWALVNHLPPSLLVVQEVLQRVGIPFHVERDARAIRIPFVCDVKVHGEDGSVQTREVPQRVLVTDGPGLNDITCTAIVPLYVPAPRRVEAVKMATQANELAGRLRIEVDPLTGTIGVVTLNHSQDAPLTSATAERAIAQASPIAGSCHELLEEWLTGHGDLELTSCCLALLDPEELA